MNLFLSRSEISDQGAFGHLKDENFNVIAYTAERTWLQDDTTWQPKIPLGTYTCKRGMHQLEHMIHPFETFEILDVPDFMGKSVSGCLIHVANWPQIELDGCIAVGEAITDSSKGRMITSSATAFDDFLKLEAGLDAFTLTITP